MMQCLSVDFEVQLPGDAHLGSLVLVQIHFSKQPKRFSAYWPSTGDIPQPNGVFAPTHVDVMFGSIASCNFGSGPIRVHNHSGT